MLQFAAYAEWFGFGYRRTMATIMANYQNTDGSITVPDVSRKYMDINAITASKTNFVF
ncbi:hypothetical protein [Anaplasma bovis]|uniref:hypothetical protein n=1 Tax=Anaplasma bovis TaxID=186733 RepID=UPI002FEE74BE